MLLKIWQFGKGGSKHSSVFRPKSSAIVKKNAKKEGFTLNMTKVNFKVNVR